MRAAAAVGLALAVLLASCGAGGNGGGAPAMLRRAVASVVMVDHDEAVGSGVAVAPGWVLTCSHVVNPRHQHLKVRWGGRWWPALVTRDDPAADLALIYAPGLPAPPVAVAAADPEQFDQLWSLSHPDSMSVTAAPEVLDGPGSRAGTWRLTGFAHPGSSGGAVLDGDGELVCVVDAIWGAGAMVECVGRAAVVRFLAGPPARPADAGAPRG